MIYYQNAYLGEYQSKVRGIEANKVLLEETIFFPQGTEAGDTGTINNHKVVKVKRDREKNEIWHILEKAPNFSLGEVVTLKINWLKRYKMMRLHSALHLLASCFDSQFGQRAVAGTVEPDLAFLVFKQPVDKFINDAVNQTNSVITNGLEIRTYEDEKRKGFRWCQIGNYSPIPCGGIHVKNAREIGKLILKEKRPDGAGQRLSILCYP